MKLSDYVKTAGGAELEIDTSSAPPSFLSLLRRLDRLELLRDDVLVSMLGQAPCDPYGIFGALKQHLNNWEFEPGSCSIMSILAKKGDLPVAILQVDLLSGDLVFIARQEGKLEVVDNVTAHQLLTYMRTSGVTGEMVWDYINSFIERAITKGQAS